MPSTLTEDQSSSSTLSLANDKVTCLGLYDAGWVDFIEYYCKKIKSENVYNILNQDKASVLDRLLQESINKDPIYLKYVNQNKDMNAIMNSVFAALDESGRKNFLKTYIISIYMNLKTTLDLTPLPSKTIIDNIEKFFKANPADKDFRQSFMEIFKELLQSSSDSDEKLKQINLVLDEKIKTVGKEKASFSLYSKAIIATTLQANIEKFFKGEPLIPIQMVFKKHDEQYAIARVFEGDLEKVIDKTLGLYCSSQELRLIYRLMHEIPDETIKKIMQETFSLKKLKIDKQGSKTLETIQNPWDTDPEKWKARVRTENRKPYYQRPSEELPIWIKKLLEFKNDCEKEFKISTLPQQHHKKIE